jgi:hypothetical protein
MGGWQSGHDGDGDKMSRGWSQVNLDRWMLLEHVDATVDASWIVVSHIRLDPSEEEPWEWRVEASDENDSRDLSSGRAGSMDEARRRAESAADRALTELRQASSSGLPALALLRLDER